MIRFLVCTYLRWMLLPRLTDRLKKMTQKITCSNQNCKKTDYYDKSELINIGTFASTIWAVLCHHCGNRIKLNEDKNDFPKNKDLILEFDEESGGVKIGRRERRVETNKKGNAFERAYKGDIKEYWVQLFFKEHYQDYGFKSIKGPFDVGPDFITKGGIGIEIERNWRSYINHGHPSNKEFSKVEYLILLSPETPPADKLRLLPDTILYIDIEKFVPWFREKCKEFIQDKEKNLEEQQLLLRIELIKGEFYRRYLEVCPDRDRDMAICPSCQGCAYEPEYDFSNWSVEFIMYYNYSIMDEEFSYGDIKPEHLDDFFKIKLE